MAITRAQVEAILVRRCGKWLADAELDATVINGTNTDLNDPIGYAVRALGLTVSNLLSVSDADLAAVEDGDTDKLLDYAELRTLETVYQSNSLVDISIGPRSERLGQLRDGVAAAIARKREQIRAAYGSDVGALNTGVVVMDFQETDT